MWIWYLRERPWRDFAPSFEGCGRNNSTAVSRRISLHFIPEWSYQQHSTTLSQSEVYFGDSCELVVTRLVLLPSYLSQCHKSWRSSFLDIRSYFITPDDTCLRGPSLAEYYRDSRSFDVILIDRHDTFLSIIARIMNLHQRMKPVSYQNQHP